MARAVTPSGVFYLVKDTTLVGGPPDTWRTEWIPWPSDIQNAQFVVVCKSRVSGDATIRLATTWDMDMEQTVVGSSIAAVGTTVMNTTGGIGPFVAVRFLMTTAGSSLVVSAYVTTKLE